MGFEETLKAEMEKLGVRKCEIVRRAVKGHCSAEQLVALNYQLRTALSVQVLIKEFSITSVDEFYKKSFNIAWEEYFHENKSFKIDNTVFSTFFNNSGFASLKLKDAVVDRFKKMKGFRPNVNLLKPDVFIHLTIQENRVIIGFNTSGDPLFKRGYRQKTSEAPINEVLAASLLMTSSWDRTSSIANPMCGSGTIGIEAALIALNKAPNIQRKTFGYENLGFLELKENTKENIRRQIVSEEIDNEDFIVHCHDIDSEMIYATQLNASNAEVLGRFRAKKADFFNEKVKNKAKFVFINPPYDERMELEEPEEFYEDLGSRLKQGYGGSKTYIISTFEDVYKCIGLKPQNKLVTTNGALKAHFFGLDIFEGNMKEYKTKNN
jgi:putative N6-adenine-specific DNA methylase